MSTKITIKQEAFLLVRKLKGWKTDADLAKAMKVDRSTVHRNLKNPTVSLEFVSNLMRALDKALEPEDLFDEVDDQP